MSEQRKAGKELDAEIAERVMGVSLDMPRERALSMIGANFVRSTGHVFTVDYGDGDEHLPMPPGENLAGRPSDDNWNQRYFRYVAETEIEKGGARAAKIERLVAQCRLTPEPYSTNIAAAWLVVEEMSFSHSFGLWRACEVSSVSRGWLAKFTLSVYPPARDDAEEPGERVGYGDTAPLAICLAALAAVAATAMRRRG